MESFKDVLAKIQDKDIGKYVKHEWQMYGYRLARFLDDMDRVSLYMRLAKTEDRNTLQDAWDFIKESNNPRSKSRLFLWKLSKLKSERKAKKETPPQDTLL